MIIPGMQKSLVGGAAGEPVGQIIFHQSGDFIVPDGVFFVSAVCVGRGGSGQNNTTGAGGGGLAYKNNIPVTPGQTISIAVSDPISGNGTYSYFGSLFGASRGADHGDGGTGGSPVGNYDGGYSGGDNAGGAAGYAGNGGNKQNSAPVGSGAGAGGTLTTEESMGGSGVGPWGRGDDGEYIIYTDEYGKYLEAANTGGSGGARSRYTSRNQDTMGGDYGGGSAKSSTFSLGCVRIIWGAGRSFPDNAADVGGSYYGMGVKSGLLTRGDQFFGDAFITDFSIGFDGQLNVEIYGGPTTEAEAAVWPLTQVRYRVYLGKQGYEVWAGPYNISSLGVTFTNYLHKISHFMTLTRSTNYDRTYDAVVGVEFYL